MLEVSEACAESAQANAALHLVTVSVIALKILHRLVQMQMRRLPKPVIAMVAGYAVGGGHILHLVADLTVSCSIQSCLWILVPIHWCLYCLKLAAAVALT